MFFSAAAKKRATEASQGSMNALALTQPGEGYQLVSETVSMPMPGAHDVRIRVAYAGVNRADIVQGQGRYPLPEGANARLGLEVSGVIDAIGDKVLGWSVGEDVCALTEGGGYAEYVCVPASHVLSAPPRLSLAEIASVPEAAAASWLALVGKGQLKLGETVLIQGASGNIGPFMVQLARELGAKVIATAGSAEKCAMLEHFGASAIDYKTQNLADEVMRLTGGQGVDLIIDPLGAAMVQQHFDLLRFGGRLVTIGFMQGNKVEALALAKMLTRSLTWSAFTLRGQSMATKAEIMAQVRKSVMPYVATGAILPQIDSIVPFEQAQNAHKRVQESLHCGKILLEVQPSPQPPPQPAASDAPPAATNE